MLYLWPWIGDPRLMQVFEKVSFLRSSFILKTMSVSLHGLLEPSRGSFPRGDRSSIPRNREYHDTFIHSAEVRYFTHKRL